MNKRGTVQEDQRDEGEETLQTGYGGCSAPETPVPVSEGPQDDTGLGDEWLKGVQEANPEVYEAWKDSIQDSIITEAMTSIGYEKMLDFYRLVTPLRTREEKPRLGKGWLQRTASQFPETYELWEATLPREDRGLQERLRDPENRAKLKERLQAASRRK